MMLTPQSDTRSTLKAYIGQILQDHPTRCRAIQVPRQFHVYTAGDSDDYVYLIESGRVKLLRSTIGDKESLVAIYNAGDLFGESCLTGQTIRSETAIAMKSSCILQIPRDIFITALGRDSLLMPLAQYLTARIADRQRTIAALLAENKEHRLALTLLRLGRQLGQPDPNGIRIDRNICLQELAAMTGTTQLRIDRFFKRFEQLGLVKRGGGGSLVIDELKVHGYLTLIGLEEGIDSVRVQ